MNGDAARPTAPMNIALATCQRFSPLFDEEWPHQICAIKATPIGIAIAVPTSAADQPERAFNTCGIQKLKPQKPTIQRK